MVFLGFKRLLEAIQALTEALSALVEVQRQLGPALDRLNTLERTRHQFEAECEGMLLKADGKLKAASSAEARERQLKKSNDRLTDAFTPDGDAEPNEGWRPVRPDDAPAGAAEGVPPVRLALAANNKAHAVRTKWGMQ